MTPVRLYDAAHPVFAHFEYTSRGQFFSRHPLKGNFLLPPSKSQADMQYESSSNDDKQKVSFFNKVKGPTRFKIRCLTFCRPKQQNDSCAI